MKVNNIMYNSVFIRILRTFTADEFKQFNKFIHSTYFNTSMVTAKVFEAINGDYPAFESSNMSREKVFSIVHTGKKYDDVLMRKYISNLNKLAEKFLIVNNNQFPDHSLVNGLLNKGLYKLFLLRLRKAEKEFANDMVDDDYFQYQALIKGEQLNFYNRTDNEFSYESEKMNMLEIDTLYYFYRLAQVYYNKQSIAADNEYNVIHYMLDAIDIKKLYNEIESSKISNKPVLKFLLSLPLLQQTRDEAMYKEIKEFSFSHSAKYPGKTIFIGYLYLLDFITYQIDKGNYEYFKERYLVYKYEEKVRYTENTGNNNQITFATLRNYFNAALRNNDVEWAEHLIEKYADMFEKDGEKRLRSYFKAFIHFHKKKFSEALAALADFNITEHFLDDFTFTRNMRTLFLQIYFELGYIDEAFYSIDSFYHYLNRNKKVNQKNRVYFGNFLKYYKELITMVSKDDYTNLHMLKENVIENKIIKKSWLLEKINGLEYKRNSVEIKANS